MALGAMGRRRVPTGQSRSAPYHRVEGPTPEWLKAFAIRAFGERDKTVLLAGIDAVLVALAVVPGTASLRRAWVGIAALAILGLIGVVATLTRPTARAVDALPAIAAAAAGAVTLEILLPRRGA